MLLVGAWEVLSKMLCVSQPNLFFGKALAKGGTGGARGGVRIRVVWGPFGSYWVCGIFGRMKGTNCAKTVCFLCFSCYFILFFSSLVFVSCSGRC